MFKETPEGQTHSYNDGCGEPEHNKPMETKSKCEHSFHPTGTSMQCYKCGVPFTPLPTEENSEEKLTIEAMKIIDGKLCIMVNASKIPEECNIVSKKWLDKHDALSRTSTIAEIREAIGNGDIRSLTNLMKFLDTLEK